MKTFSIGAILSITTGKYLAQLSEIHELLDHMTGDTLFTHQISRAARECEQPLRDQFPNLPTEVPAIGTWDDVVEWLAPLTDIHGGLHEVRPLRPEQHTVIDPLVELAMNYPQAKVIPVALNGGEPS